MTEGHEIRNESRHHPAYAEPEGMPGVTLYSHWRLRARPLSPTTVGLETLHIFRALIHHHHPKGIGNHYTSINFCSSPAIPCDNPPEITFLCCRLLTSLASFPTIPTMMMCSRFFAIALVVTATLLPQASCATDRAVAVSPPKPRLLLMR